MKILTGVIAASGDTTILAAAAGTAYAIHEYQVQLEGSAAVTVLIKAGSETIRRIYLSAQGSYFAVAYDKPLVIRKGAGITLNISSTQSVNYMLRYSE